MGKAVVEQAETMAAGLEATLTATIRRGASASDEILSAAESTGADLIVLGTTVHMAGGNPFLGHTAEQVLENAEPTVAVVVLPETGRR
jgi:nucleotide-binding universal stress UspA family protein